VPINIFGARTNDAVSNPHPGTIKGGPGSWVLRPCLSVHSKFTSNLMLREGR
jgi:hypothetical protein